MNEVEKHFKKMNLGDYERSVPPCARLTVQECATICTFFGYEFVEHPYNDSTGLLPKITKLYEQRGMAHLAKDLSLANGAAINPAQGHPAAIWVRSAFGKHVLACVFFHNLGGALFTSINWGDDIEMQTPHWGKEYSARSLVQAACYGMGMNACCYLIETGLVRPEIAKELREQFRRETKSGQGFVGKVSPLLDLIMPEKKNGGPKDIDAFNFRMLRAKQMLLYNLQVYRQDNETAVDVQTYLQQINEQDHDEPIPVDAGRFDEEQIQKNVQTVLSDLSAIYTRLAQTGQAPKSLLEGPNGQTTQQIADQVEGLAKTMALQDLLEFDTSRLGWPTEKTLWAGDVLSQLTLGMTYAYNINGHIDGLDDAALPFLVVLGVGTTAEDTESHDGYFDSSFYNGPGLTNGRIKDANFFGHFATRKSFVTWDNRLYDIAETATVDVDLLASLQQRLLYENILPGDNRPFEFGDLATHAREQTMGQVACNMEQRMDLGPGRLLVIPGVIHGPCKSILTCWDESHHTFGLRCLDQPFDVQLLDRPGESTVAKTLNKIVTKILDNDLFTKKETKIQIYGVIPYASSANRLLLHALAAGGDNLPGLTRLARLALVEDKAVEIDFSSGIPCTGRYGHGFPAQAYALKINNRTVNSIGAPLPKVTLPNILLRPEVVRRTESVFRAVLEGSGITVKGKLKTRTR